MSRDNTIPDQISGMQDLAKQYPYMMRRRGDFFVKRLLDAEPPKEHTFATPR